jgi:hypothetical protein
MTLVTLAMLMLTAASATVIQAAPSSEASVVVRTYNYAALPAGRTLADAKAEAQNIFRSAGIWVVWIDCRVPSAAGGAACTEPLTTGRELMLRLVDRTPSEGERIVALGESMLDREQRGGVLMTVDLFRVRSIAERASTSASILLGRAIAHEIGHLLLGSAEHPRLGLMRALWSYDELRGLKPAHWGFSTGEAARMREGLRGPRRAAG